MAAALAQALTPWPCPGGPQGLLQNPPHACDPPVPLNEALELAFNLAPVGMCVTRERCIEICNDAFARMFGYEQAELLD